MQPRARCASAHTEDPGDLNQRQVGVLVKNDDGSMGGAETAECLLQGFALVERVDTRVGRAWLADAPDSHGEAAFPIRLRIAGTDKDLVKPAVEVFRVAQSGQLSPRRDGRGLERVIGRIRIAKYLPGNGQQPVTGRADQGLERIWIAGPSAPDSAASEPSVAAGIDPSRSTSQAIHGVPDRRRTMAP